jgi:hypothetical protein
MLYGLESICAQSQPKSAENAILPGEQFETAFAPDRGSATAA